MSYKEDREFERATLPYFIDILSNNVYPNSTIEVNQNKDNSKTLDQEVSMDAFIKQDRLPHQSIQMKSRRFKNYKFFKWEKDFPLNIGKITTDGKIYEGDYYKCQSNLFMYGFVNGDDPASVTELVYWAVINYSKLRDKFLDIKGWRNIPNVKRKEYKDDSITCHFIVIPWNFIQDCLIITSETQHTLLF